jgi:AcrR family transcriptional regulator/transposase-like protein
MPSPKPLVLELSDNERQVLTGWTRRRRTAPALALRSRIVLECAKGRSNTEVADHVGVSRETVRKWRSRFVRDRLKGLSDEPRPGAPRKITDEQVEQVVVNTLQHAPSNGDAYWSTRSMAKATGMSQTAVSRIWRDFGLKPVVAYRERIGDPGPRSVPGGRTAAGKVGAMSAEGQRRNEILDTASRMFAASGLRTSLQEIGDACGIKPGTLYHHFDSKEAIVVELLQRYHDELDRIAEGALERLEGADPQQASERIVGLGTAIAECAVRHSAAVQFTFYEPPAGASHELVRLATRAPTAIESAMLETLRLGRSSGFIRSGIDLAMLADRMCQTMFHVGLGTLFHSYTAAVDRVARLLCDIVLHGLAAGSPTNAELDRSDALLAVERFIRMWEKDDEADQDDRSAYIRRVARAEFGRRGYEVTTIRDIASAAGLSTGSIYRMIRSKEELLASIMTSFSQKVMAGWNAVLGSDSTAVEKLDALAWLHINVLEHFNDEFKIQLAWLRQSPPDATNPGWSFPIVLGELKTLLSEGARSGEIRIESPGAELTVRCVLEQTWMPEQVVRSQGKRAALLHLRDTVLRGVATR